MERKHVVFEGDALNIILTLNGSNNHLDWSGKSHILKGREMLAKHGTWSVSYTIEVAIVLLTNSLDELFQLII